MAKKAKRGNGSKRVKRKKPRPPVIVEPECAVEIVLTDAVVRQPETVRRLAHRVVDLLADAGLYKHLSRTVEGNLSRLVDGFVIDRITDFIEEARAAGKEAPRG